MSNVVRKLGSGPAALASIIAIEVALNALIISVVKYTEIDWQAYMQEVGGVLGGTFDYRFLRGDTGPLVYPAGFVYLFSGLYAATSEGQDVRFAQWIFFGFYLLHVSAVGLIFLKTKMPSYLLLWMTLTSYRVHSIFVLRLFNDPLAMIFLYLSVTCFMNHRFSAGSILFSLAVSIKMNILLFAPGLLLIYLVCLGLKKTIVQLAICGGIQLALGAPFLAENWTAYLIGAFNLGRQFEYKWTVNWKMLDENLFLDRRFHAALLGLHLLTLAVFAVRLLRALKFPPRPQLLSSHAIVLILFTSNFIGMCFARSLHYQFYSWYYHTLPWLLWHTKLPVPFRFVVLLAIEYAWNVFPATPFSSMTLHACHFVILVALLHAPALPINSLKPPQSKSQ